MDISMIGDLTLLFRGLIRLFLCKRSRIRRMEPQPFKLLRWGYKSVSGSMAVSSKIIELPRIIG